jgi:serine/threonine-protein kinase
MTTDRNLLFGILALQMDFIDRDELVRAMNAWMLDKEQTLGQILVAQSVIDADTNSLLDALLVKHLAQHANDTHESLAALSSLGSARNDLEQIADSELHHTLGRVPSESISAIHPTQASDLKGGDGPEPFAPGTFASTRASPLPVQTIRYRILRPHAKGGLGQVFVAQDEEVQREVALKEIQGEHADNPESRARFLQEATITGALEHPGIVPVYGLGTYADGRPFYAMRFIRGDSLNDAIRRFHKADEAERDPGQRALELHQLLKRFIDVCNAVAYAHSRGVLHRDLKPGNVMLGKYGETLVVDWGLAKPMGAPETHPVTGELPVRPSTNTSDTLPGMAVGTPQFMSPEQAAGRLDQLGPASDVYSLGATLFALLTGKTPFEGRIDIGELLRRVQRGEFPPPRQVKRDVPPALEAICLKAMRVQPQDRYSSAGELARDIERWLADELVSAYQAPLGERLRRWARIHKPLVAASVALLLTALITLAVSTVLIWREQAQTERERLRAEQLHQTAETNFNLARKAVKEMLTEVAQDQLATEPRMEEKRKVLLRKAKEYYETFLQQQQEDPALRGETAMAYKQLGDIERLLEQVDQAKMAYDQAIVLLTDLASEHPDDANYKYSLAEAYTNLGEVLRKTTHLHEARKAYTHAFNIQEQLATAHPRELEYRQAQGQSLYNLGILLTELNQFPDAVRQFGMAIDILQLLVTDFQSRKSPQQHLARAYLNYAVVLRKQQKWADAEHYYQEAIRLLAGLLKGDPGSPEYAFELAATHNNLANLLRDRKRFREARAESEEALKLYRELAASFPRVPKYRAELGNALNSLGITRVEESLAWRRLGAVGMCSSGDNMTLLAELVKVHVGYDSCEGARACYSEAWPILEQVVKESPDVADYKAKGGLVHGNLGWLHLHLLHYQEARSELEKAIPLMAAAVKANPQQTGWLRNLRNQYLDLMDVLLLLGEHSQARAAARSLAETSGNDGPSCYLAAQVLANYLGRAEQDPHLPESKRVATITEFIAEVRRLLKLAEEKHYPVRKQIDEDPVFKALKQRYPDLGG